MTYEELKKADDLKVKDWFECKISYPYFANDNWRTDFDIVKETEKAVCINIEINSCDGEWTGTRDVWVPKSCFESFSEYAVKEAERKEAYDIACEKYDALVAFCKENKVKGARYGLRKDNLLAKVAAAGLTYNY